MTAIGIVELCMILTQLISAIVIRDHTSKVVSRVNDTITTSYYYDPSTNLIITFAWALLHIVAIGFMFYGIAKVLGLNLI